VTSGERLTIMRFGVKVAVTGAVAAGTLVVPIAAHAATVAAPPSWAHRTCWAEQSYVQHPSVVALNTMLTASEHVTWKYIGKDAAGLYTAVRGGKPATTISRDEAYMSQDCSKYV
jgi:hypothetical protein